ncbi:MAG: spermidine synthase [Hyphomonadaceae bacterium]
MTCRAGAAGLLAALALLSAGPAAAACAEGVIPGPPVLQRESVYNSIFVHRAGDCASLTFRRHAGAYLESLSDLSDPRALPLAYTQAMTVAFAYPAALNEVAEIGVGAGTLFVYAALHLPKARLTGVELDGAVVKLAREYFGARKYETARAALAEKDGRLFLRATDRRYDVIFLDAFRGGYIPDHLTTRQFYALAQSRLRPGGVLVANLHYGTKFFESSIATLRDVFARVDLYWAGGNVIAVAGDSMPAGEELAARAAARQNAFAFRYPLSDQLKRAFAYAPPADAPVLTDDFAPANQLEAIASANKRRP